VVRVRLKGINQVRKRLADGSTKIYYYHRASGKPLRGEPGTPEFIASFADIEKNIIAARSGETFSLLVRTYTQSIEFQQLAATTRTEYRRMLTAAEAEFGTMPIEALGDSRVRGDFMSWREKVAHASGHREADHRLSAISAMLSWAVERGQITSNHVKGFRRLYHADRAEIIWLPEHIEAFMEVAPIELQRAIILASHTGQRQADLLRLTWTAYDGQTLELRQGKSRRGGKPGLLVEIACTQALKTMLDQIERISPYILTTKTGKPFKKRYFARLWEETMLAAGIKTVQLPGIEDPVDLHFHDLRGGAVTMLSEAGCTPQMVAAITGHTLQSVHRILERYLARTRGLAEAAIETFENSPRTKIANRLQTGIPQNKSGRKKKKSDQ
jgi:integrase